MLWLVQTNMMFCLVRDMLIKIHAWANCKKQTGTEGCSQGAQAVVKAALLAEALMQTQGAGVMISGVLELCW